MVSALARAGGLFLFLSASSAWGLDLKVLVEDTDVYRIDFEDLVKAGVESDARFESARLGMKNLGKAVPLYVQDGGDGVLGPGDWIEFVGAQLGGEVSYLNEYTRYNVYVLSTAMKDAPRMKAAPSVARRGGTSDLVVRRRLEEDKLMLRLRARGDVRDELWYWHKLSHADKAPVTIALDLDHLDRRRDKKVHLKVGFRGWSSPRHGTANGLAHHRVELMLNGAVVEAAEWNGIEPHVVELPPIRAARFQSGRNQLKLSIPRRRPQGKKAPPLVDVVMLNWVEVEYPRDDRFGDGSARVEVQGEALSLTTMGRTPLVAYGNLGTRLFASAPSSTYRVTDLERRFMVVSEGAQARPPLIVVDRPSALKKSKNQADYIMIAHPTLKAAVEPLAAFHRKRGLRVMVVDVNDVYDEFNHGVENPEALRDFLGYAYKDWARPAPKFVLLVGDASWDARNEIADDQNYTDHTFRARRPSIRFARIPKTLYAEAAHRNQRGLVPTWMHDSVEGHSASDNWFVAHTDGFLPDMAIGRLPVVTPEDVSAIVDKTIRYARPENVGPWRHHVLMITNEQRSYQAQSDALSGQNARRGYTTEKVYPSPETGNERHSKRLVEAFGRGQLLVHFLGHGGRYIWRTGPPDLKKNHDLFTLEHLDQLAPHSRLPIVLSMTCFSAPFDHPNADSIGEKLLRLDGRGAVAVVAASWRNRPNVRWGEGLFGELLGGSETVGEAFLRSKRVSKARDYVQTYNLLGDPALPLARPSGRVGLRLEQKNPTAIVLSGEVGVSSFSGRLVFDLIDGKGSVLKTFTRSTKGPAFKHEIALDRATLEALRVVTVYAWDEEGGDGLGVVELEEQERG